MAAETTPRGAEPDERGSRDKARTGGPVKRRRKPLLGLGIVLILLLVSKIMISGVYLNLWPARLGHTPLAMAESAAPSKSDPTMTQEPSDC